MLVFSLLWGGPGYAKDLEALFRILAEGLDALGHARRIEVGLDHIRASSDAPTLIDAACLNSLGGRGAAPVQVSAHEVPAGRRSLDRPPPEA